MPERHLYTNRLIHQKSPYLLQHAHNPVDWYPWGDEAFRAAQEQDKPIFLSIGYATCHWCHVMEKESFENREIAELMNGAFINIKVDREELPEVDNLYMEFAQSMMSGSAGWPLNIILTPELQPFFAATYLPPRASHGLAGLDELIMRIKEVWSGEEKERVIEQADHIVGFFEANIHTDGDRLPEREQIINGAELLFKMADPQFGGIRGTPKFPIGYQWNFLLHYAWMSGDSRSLFITERTLEMMHKGGIYDHLGGGFSRYSVDEHWLIPHFEKMLYDNAILAYTYFEGWLVTQSPIYRSVCESILNYVLRDMTHPEGGFYSAEDADSEGHEGTFYTWSQSEISNILGLSESELFCEFYGVTQEGNFEGKNILHTPVGIEEFTQKKGMDSQELERLFAMQRQILWKVRERRPHPFKDDKILSAWNGLMIYALAECGKGFEEEKYTQAAVRAATFIKNHLWKEGVLLRRWRDGEALFKGSLDDYAFLIKGVLSLFETGQGTHWLEWAIEIAEILKGLFKAENGAFYQMDGLETNLILRKCHYSDGAEPSGNAIHCENLLRLYQLTLDRQYLEQAEDILKAVYKFVEGYSPGYCYHLLNVVRFYDVSAITAVVVLNKEHAHEKEIGELLYHHFLPHRAIIWKRPNDQVLARLIPFIEQYQPVEGQTTLYLCSQGACSKPMTSLSEMITEILNGK